MKVFKINTHNREFNIVAGDKGILTPPHFKWAEGYPLAKFLAICKHNGWTYEEIQPKTKTE